MINNKIFVDSFNVQIKAIQLVIILFVIYLVVLVQQMEQVVLKCKLVLIIKLN